MEVRYKCYKRTYTLLLLFLMFALQLRIEFERVHLLVKFKRLEKRRDGIKNNTTTVRWFGYLKRLPLEIISE